MKVIFKKEINQYMDEEKNKCIRHILWTVENFLPKGSDQEARIRKAVLDAVNDYHRKTCILLDKVIE